MKHASFQEFCRVVSKQKPPGRRRRRANRFCQLEKWLKTNEAKNFFAELETIKH